VTLTLSQQDWNIGLALCPNEVNIWLKIHEIPSRGLEVTERTQNTWFKLLNTTGDLDLDPAMLEHVFCTSSWPKFQEIPSRVYKLYMVKTPLVSLDLVQAKLKHRLCALSGWGEHFTKDSWNSFQGFRSYRADAKYMVQTFKGHWWPRPWADKVGIWVVHIVLMGEHLTKVSWNSFQGLRSYGVDMKPACMPRRMEGWAKAWRPFLYPLLLCGGG
jgi:hypothetical protein